ncbi:hypothetical protein ACSBR2_017091 [Camellia fascicularis]
MRLQPSERKIQLCLAERATLIQSVTSATLTYSMQSTLLRSSVCTAIDKCHKRFLWEGDQQHRCMSLVTWDVVLAGLKGFNGQLEFHNVDELETMVMAEHFMATDIEWDPTGRYVATSVTSVHEMENGFNIWSFNGKLLYRILKDHFFQHYVIALDLLIWLCKELI